MSAVVHSRLPQSGEPCRRLFRFGSLLAASGLLALACTWPRPVMAQTLAGEALAKKMQCLACHQVDKRRVGPAFRLVAERFAGREGAVDFLAYAVRHGGRGSWGAIPMPEQPHVSDADAKRLAEWILSLSVAGESGSPKP